MNFEEDFKEEQHVKEDFRGRHCFTRRLPCRAGSADYISRARFAFCQRVTPFHSRIEKVLLKQNPKHDQIHVFYDVWWSHTLKNGSWNYISRTRFAFWQRVTPFHSIAEMYRTKKIKHMIKYMCFTLFGEVTLQHASWNSTFRIKFAFRLTVIPFFYTGL